MLRLNVIWLFVFSARASVCECANVHGRTRFTHCEKAEHSDHKKYFLSQRWSSFGVNAPVK